MCILYIYIYFLSATRHPRCVFHGSRNLKKFRFAADFFRMLSHERGTSGGVAAPWSKWCRKMPWYYAQNPMGTGNIYIPTFTIKIKATKKSLPSWWYHVVFLNVHPYLWKWSNLTNIFQTGWNRHLACIMHIMPCVFELYMQVLVLVAAPLSYLLSIKDWLWIQLSALRCNFGLKTNLVVYKNHSEGLQKGEFPKNRFPKQRHEVILNHKKCFQICQRCTTTWTFDAIACGLNRIMACFTCFKGAEKQMQNDRMHSRTS